MKARLSSKRSVSNRAKCHLRPVRMASDDRRVAVFRAARFAPDTSVSRPPGEGKKNIPDDGTCEKCNYREHYDDWFSIAVENGLELDPPGHSLVRALAN